MKPQNENHDDDRKQTTEPAREAAQTPGKDDVHEQRQDAQPHEGTVSGAPAQNPPPRH